MRKITKIISIIIMVCLMCVPLFGCEFLDEFLKSQNNPNQNNQSNGDPKDNGIIEVDVGDMVELPFDYWSGIAASYIWTAAGYPVILRNADENAIFECATDRGELYLDERPDLAFSHRYGLDTVWIRLKKPVIHFIGIPDFPLHGQNKRI